MSRKIRILAIGKHHDKALLAAITDYETRLGAKLRLSWQFLPHTGQILTESNAIRKSLKDTEYVIVLDDTGSQLSSEKFSEKLQSLAVGDKDICFVIGGAYGVDDALLKQADFVWSLGVLTLPHQLVRLVLIEQLYRAVTIWDGGSYHHGT